MSKKLKIVILVSVLILVIVIALFSCYLVFNNKNNEKTTKYNTTEDKDIEIPEETLEQFDNDNKTEVSDNETQEDNTSVESENNTTDSTNNSNTKANDNKKSNDSSNNEKSDNTSSNSQTNNNEPSTNESNSETNSSTNDDVQDNTTGETKPVNEKDPALYVGIPYPYAYYYSVHKGQIDYKVEDYPDEDIMDVCLKNAIEISLKDTGDIINTVCYDVLDGTGAILGEYLRINCQSGNCDRYKE